MCHEQSTGSCTGLEKIGDTLELAGALRNEHGCHSLGW